MDRASSRPIGRHGSVVMAVGPEGIDRHRCVRYFSSVEVDMRRLTSEMVPVTDTSGATETLQEQVMDRCAAAARPVATSQRRPCCDDGSGRTVGEPCGDMAADGGCRPARVLDVDQAFGSSLYTPGGTTCRWWRSASLGCGNPTAVADLREGERLLDLGSGGDSTCCCQLNGSDRAASPMASTFAAPVLAARARWPQVSPTRGRCSPGSPPTGWSGPTVSPNTSIRCCCPPAPTQP